MPAASSLVMGSRTRSTSAATPAPAKLARLTGGVTFYHSDVRMTRVRFNRHRGEDALNVVHARAELTDCAFLECGSDAFDGDFVTGRIERCRFEEVGGDAVDLDHLVDPVRAEHRIELGHLPGGQFRVDTMDQRLVSLTATDPSDRMTCGKPIVPASHQVDFELLKDVSGARGVELASEADFRFACPGCEVGAMPPFGNLYGMNVYVDEDLTEDSQVIFI